MKLASKYFLDTFSDLGKVRLAIPNVEKELHNVNSEMANKRREEAECSENVRFLSVQ